MDSTFTIAVVLMLTNLLALNRNHVEGCGGCGPSPRNGEWGSWYKHDGCPNGYSYKTRRCDSPSPAHGGRKCKGSNYQLDYCNQCSDNNGGCAHSCENSYGAYRCNCRKGYRTSSSNWKKCERVTCAKSEWPSPTNGQMSCSNQAQVHSGTTCQVTCNHGYKIEGHSLSTCGNNGKWDKQIPRCRVTKCSKLYVPSKGKITPYICTSTPTHGQWCSFECHTGYKRYGPRGTMCDNENWTNGNFFECRDETAPSFGKTCPSQLSVIANKGKTTATVAWDPVIAEDSGNTRLTTYPNVKSPHEFAEGKHTVIYTATDDSQNRGFCYFKVNVKVIRCRILTPPENGKFVTGPCLNLYGIVCHFMCNKGYDLKGPRSTTCTINGQWSGNEIKCEAVRCPFLDNPEHAIKTGYGCNDSTSRYGTSCFFTCLLGYKAVGGSSKRTCRADRQWTGTMLQCQAVRCPAMSFKSEGLLIKPPVCINSSVDLAYETDCRFSCKEGYQLLGPWRKTCDQYNKWSPTTNPSCKDVSGPTFLNCPQNIFKTADRGTTSVLVWWNSPTATDNSGFTPNVTHSGKRRGERFSSGEYSIRFLASDKVGNVGECQFKVVVSVVRCVPRLYAPRGGTKTCTKGNMYGSQCSFTCHIGFTMTGSDKRVCEKNLTSTSSTGFWTGNETKCELVRCSHLLPPPNSVQLGCGAGARDNVFGDKCLLYCNIGYRLIKGSTQRICQANGTWSGQEPYCQAVRCHSLQIPNDGHVTPNSCTVSPLYGTTCLFSCRKGYRLQGKAIASCLKHGEWSTNTSTYCKDVERPLFGSSCPSDITRFAGKAKNYTTITWPPIVATDNSGVPPGVVSSGVNNIYYRGKHLVMYNASDKAGNYKVCKFYATVLVLRCQKLLPPLNGDFVGDCDDIYGSTCRMSCNDGYELFGAENITCEAKPGHLTGYWSGAIPICKVRKCSPLTAPAFGFIYPHMCTSFPVSGTSCYFECSHGFLGDGGVNMTHCGNDGEWTIHESLILKCVDVTPPMILNCPSDIRASLSANASALVNWKIPVALDNSNVKPQITVSPSGMTPPYNIYNSTLLVYTARDTSGNTKECSFKILLEDNLSPEVVYCPPDQNISVTQMKTVVKWKTPQFKDNSNSPLLISCSHRSGTAFYWGTWNVHCKAYDNNPSNKPAVCRFTLRLKPKECKDLLPPKNGAKACDDWALGRMCSPFCNDKWDFTQQLPPFAIWSCGASGRWFPPMRWPDCTKVHQPNKARMAMELYYYNGDCNSPKAQAEIKQNFIKLLVGSVYRQICQDDVFKDKCTAENVKVTCALVESVTNRMKRSPDDAEVHTGTRRSLIPQTTISLDIVVLLETNETDDSKESKIRKGLEGVEIAKSISTQIKTAVDNGSLSLTVNSTVFSPDKESLNISEPERLCTTGQAYRDGYCVSCSSGTYLNKTLGTCEDCPVGTYQNRDSQETCVLCPPRTSTEETRTYNHSGCLAICNPGSYSPTGLEPCIPCEKGFFQEVEGQRRCLKCGLGTTTSEEGSNSSKQCGVPCPAGSFSPTGIAPCSLCDQRSFQPHNESRTCIPCPGTTVADQPGSMSFQDCKEISKCESNPCKGNFACTNLIDDFLCTCQPGYTGKQCDIDIDDCRNQPCYNNGTCHDLVNNYTCTCAQGYRGLNCEDDVDECFSSPCSNHSSCINTPGGYVCQCEPGFTGSLCDTDTDECLLSPCQNGATCRDGINNYECHCLIGYHGKDCEKNVDDCSSDPCQNEAICVDGVASYHCICPEGFNGTNCEQEIDECTNAVCKNNATCLDQVNGFYCICQEGFLGKTCEFNIDECVSNPCKNHARCEDKVNSYRCDCKDGFDGLYCESNIDDCASNPCSNNGTCHDGVNNFTCVCPLGLTGNTCSLDIDFCTSIPCLNNASCINGLTSFTCQCPDGFSGDQCQHNIDECENTACLNGGTCIDGINEYKCLCPAGFTGFNCEININECANNPCLNEGICTDLLNDFQCACTSGYTGRNCVVEINECLSSQCQNNATCIDEVNNYTCACVDGFTGQHCEENINDCLVHACADGSTCKDEINSYTCDCPPGFVGKHCEIEFDECDSFPCLFDGTCHDQIGGYYCSCHPGFTGQRCEVNIDDCQSNPCVNNGSCTDLVASYSCSCPNGFTGVHCENRIDYCKGVNCTQNGACENLLIGFRCNCDSGYFGKYCELEIDECLVEPCFNNAACYDAVNNFTCACTEGFTGRYCELNIDECVKNSCQNNASCIDHILGYSCLCAEGYNGTHCQTEINECESNPCKNNGTCVDQTPGYRCRCLDEYTGLNCENLTDFCSSFPCQNGGTCRADNSTGRFTCLCKTGFTGVTCDVDIDDCALDPCMPNSYCLDLVNGYECKCHPSYTGERCDIFLGSNFDLIFERQTTNDMVILTDGDSVPNMRSLTIGLYVKANSAYKSGTLFSYSVPSYPKDIIILSFGESKIEMRIKDKVVGANFQLADDLWHFLGIIWNGLDGSVSVYVDGREIKKTENVLRDDTITGGGWVVLGQRYLAGKKRSSLSTAFVGTLHQVNVWNVAGTRDHMWKAGHNCSWPIAGSMVGWTSFLPGIKGEVEKRFMTQCKALDTCTFNCSHFLACESRHGFYNCTCQAGFSGYHCDINIDECSSSPCVNGKCVDGVNRYHCMCNKGYWGTNCENKITNEGECPPLPGPVNGRKSCNHFSGKVLCTMTCNEGYSYDTEAINEYDCGPDTEWRWNGLTDFKVPACSSKAAPKEIEHRFQVKFREMQCEPGQSLSNFRSAVQREISDILSAVPGCLNSSACKLKQVAVPGCGWTANQRKRRAVTNELNVLFSLSVRAANSPPLTDDVEEKSEAILFQMQYAVSTGNFRITFNGVNSTADRSSFKYLSFDIMCNPGFVKSKDRKECVACSVGSFYWLELSFCSACSRGTYQDEEGQLSCKPCGEGKTTYFPGAASSEDCFLKRDNL